LEAGKAIGFFARSNGHADEITLIACMFSPRLPNPGAPEPGGGGHPCPTPSGRREPVASPWTATPRWVEVAVAGPRMALAVGWRWEGGRIGTFRRKSGRDKIFRELILPSESW